MTSKELGPWEITNIDATFGSIAAGRALRHGSDDFEADLAFAVEVRDILRERVAEVERGLVEALEEIARIARSCPDGTKEPHEWIRTYIIARTALHRHIGIPVGDDEPVRPDQSHGSIPKNDVADKVESSGSSVIRSMGPGRPEDTPDPVDDVIGKGK